MRISTSRNEQTKYSYHYLAVDCLPQLRNAILTLLLDMNRDYSKEIVFLCVGTDRATGDCLGPLVGTSLKALLPQAPIYGTLENPANALNLPEVIASIAEDYNNPLIIAVDACLGMPDRVGYINVELKGLKPGTALNKCLPEVGDFSISGIVNVGGFLEQMVLQNTRLNIVYQLADIITKSLYIAYTRFFSYESAREIRRKALD